MKYTKKEVQSMFKMLVRAINKPEINFHLDYIACYGGYVIEEIGELGSVSHPFGCYRRKSKEMYLSMCMTAQGLEMLRYTKAGTQ